MAQKSWNAVSCLLLALISWTGIASAQEFYQLTDKYSCARLSDGKLHVVIVSNTGFSTVKKGKALKFIATQIASVDQRLENLADIRHKFQTNGINDNLIRRTDNIIKSLGLEPEPIEDLEGVRIVLDKLKASLKTRRQLLRFQRQSVSDCINNKLPGIQSIYGTFTPYYARATLNSSVGIIIRVPKAKKKDNLIGVCVVSRDALNPNPERRNDRYVQFIGMVSGPFCLGGSLKPPDKNGCTGNDVSVPGLLTGYVRRVNYNTGSQLGPDPNSDSVQSHLAAIGAADWDFQLLLSDTPQTGFLCQKLRENLS